MRRSNQQTAVRRSERGNILFIILIAVVLIGVLTAAIQTSNRPEGANIDNETLVIRATEVQRYAAELERAVLFILQNGKSENDIRFAHPDAPSDYGDLSLDVDPSDQIFHVRGGGATYSEPPEDVNDGSAWEFYAGTALPGAGSNKAELIAVLPNVTPEFCERINIMNGQNGAPADTGGSAAAGASPGDCLNIGAVGRFRDAQTYYAAPNTVDETTFEQDPATAKARTALQACVLCAADGERHFYHVLLAR